MLEEKTESYDNSLNKGTPPPPISCNKVYPALLSLLLLISLFAFAAPARALTQNAEGVYELATSQDLIDFREAVNAGSNDISAKLTADIDLGGANWKPIADGTIQYAGTFDGGGHTVSNYKITSNDLTQTQGSYFAGLFGWIAASGIVRNLTVSGDTNVTVTDGGVFAGGVAGYNNHGLISDCENRGAVRASTGNDSSNVGGVTGGNEGTISNCLNGGAVTASADGNSNYAGGVTGNNVTSGTITNCLNGGAVTTSGSSGLNSAGGVAGLNRATIKNCSNSGFVRASDSSVNYAGGVVGYNVGAGEKITNCANSGNVEASGGRLGGIVGNNEGRITNCGWLVSGDVNQGLNVAAGYGTGQVTDAASLDSMENIVTTVLPARRNIMVSRGGATVFTSYPGTAEDMSGYFSVTSSDTSPAGFASIDRNGWPYTLTGAAGGRATLTVSVNIYATDFSNPNNLAHITTPLSTNLNCAITVLKAAVSDDKAITVITPTAVVPNLTVALGDNIVPVQANFVSTPEEMQTAVRELEGSGFTVEELTTDSKGNLAVTNDMIKKAIADIESRVGAVSYDHVTALPVVTSSAGQQDRIHALGFNVSGDIFGDVKDVKMIKVIKLLPNSRSLFFDMVTDSTEFGDKKAALLDADGNIVTGAINRASRYTLTIFILDGGDFDLSKNEPCKVTDPIAVLHAQQTQSTTPTPSGGSSGGCAAGIGATALLALPPLALRRRKK
ncbi:MAG: Synerg-CTERM sorting domain-containing protein [Synergistaceae bacterium]|nr:Synerg-CTERM sorting domain-containing protein [Synergistaceae bacterium]